MAEQVSRIIIKSSTGSETPASGDLYRGELGYSYKSDRLFIGNETDDSNYVIGGRAFFELFNDIVDGNGDAQHGIVFPHNVIIAGPNKDLDELDIKKLKLNGEELFASANNLNLFSNIDGIIIANTLPNVSHTQLASAQAIKEYVDIKTDIISDFINGTPAPAQLLIGNEQSKFEYVDVTGAVEFYANGYSTLRNSSVTNSMIEDAYVQIGLQKVELGKAIVPNLNLDTSGILKVNRGGTGKSSHPENQLLIGNNISEFTSSENLIYDSANQIFTVKASTLLDDLTSNNITVNGYLLLNGDTNISSNTVGFSGNTQVIIEGNTIIEGATFNITNTTNLIIEGDTNYYSNNVTFSNTTTVVVEGDTYYYSNNVTISNNTTFSVTGNTTVSGDSFFVSNNTSVEISGNTIISGDTFNISNNTIFDVDGSTILNGDTIVNGDLFISNNSTTIIESPLVSNNLSVFNGDVVFNNSPSFEEDVFFQKNITVEKDAYIVGDLYVSGNTVAVEAQRVLVEDNILVLGANNTTDFVDLGFVGQYDGNNYAGIIRSALEDKFYVVEDYFPEPNDTLHNFNENTMLGVLRGNFEADRIEIASGNANNITITNSFADDFHIDYGTANTFTSTRIDVQTMYPQLINAQTIKVFDNLEVYKDFKIFPSANTQIYGEVELINSFITLTNSDIYIDPNSSLNIDGIFDALTVNAASYSGIYLNMIENVNAVANNGQVLTADGTGSFYFADTSTELKLLTDVNSTASNNQVLTADGLGNFFFADAATKLKELTDVSPLALSDEILTAYGNGTFYFSNTANLHTLVAVNTTSENITVNNITANTYSGIYLDMLENVNATSTIDQVLTSNGAGGFYFANNIHTTTFASLVDVNATASNNQVLTADGTGNFYFADAGTELKLLTDVNSTASNNQVLTADGLGNFYFTGVTFELKELIDVYSNSNVNEILTAYGNGVYYFSDTLTNVHIDSSSANNLTIDNIVINSGQLDNADLTNINILSGLANNLTITNSTLTNVNVTGGNSDNYTSNNATINSSEINNSTINNPTINNGTANNLTLTNTTLNSNTTLNGYVTINNTLEVASDLHVDGDLFVNGNTITLDAQTLTVEDNIVVLGSNNVSDITDLGFAFKYNNGVSDEYAGFFRDATDQKFYLFKDFLADPPVTTMTGFNTSSMLATLFGDFEANNLIASSGSLENMIANNITMTYSTIENSVIDCGTF